MKKIVITSALALLTLVACQPEPGPAEKVGRNIDEAANEVRASMKHAEDKFDETAAMAGEAIENTGEQIAEGIEEATENPEKPEM